MRTIWVSLLGAMLVFSIVSARVGTEVRPLHPDTARESDRLDFVVGKDIARYALYGPLRSSAHYEVRISYPATMPTLFRMRLETTCERSLSKPAAAVTTAPHRQLLNIEKVSFETDDQGELSDVAEAPAEADCAELGSSETPSLVGYFVVKAIQEGIPPTSRPELKNSHVEYDIVLESMIYTNIPYSAITVAIIVLACVGTLVAGLYWSHATGRWELLLDKMRGEPSEGLLHKTN